MKRSTANYRDLVLTLVTRELKVRYRRSVLGFMWTMLQPLLTMCVFYVVFSAFFRFQIRNYPVYALAGLLFWNFFQQSIITSMNSLRANAGIILKLPVPKVVFPIATVISGVINLLFAMAPILALMVIMKYPITPALLFLPVSILIATIFTMGAGLLLAPLAVFFSDVVELVGVLLTLMMYLTPTFYPMEIVPPRFLFLVRYNPIRSIMEVFRDPIYHGKIPPLSHIAVSVVIAFTFLAVGAIVFRKTSDRIPFFA